jgi:hypothetical protein
VCSCFCRPQVFASLRVRHELAGLLRDCPTASIKLLCLALRTNAWICGGGAGTRLFTYCQYCGACSCCCCCCFLGSSLPSFYAGFASLLLPGLAVEFGQPIKRNVTAAIRILYPSTRSHSAEIHCWQKWRMNCRND